MSDDIYLPHTDCLIVYSDVFYASFVCSALNPDAKSSDLALLLFSVSTVFLFLLCLLSVILATPSFEFYERMCIV